MNNTHFNIFIAFHKPSELISDEVYKPIHVGGNHSDFDNDYLCDDVGENISQKNPTYCETTAIYWIWKNYHCDYVGLNHYRRCFTFESNSIIHQFLIFTSYIKVKFLNYLHPGCVWQKESYIHLNNFQEYSIKANTFKNSVFQLIKQDKFDLIVPRYVVFPCVSIRLYWSTLNRDLLVYLENVVRSAYPSFYPYLQRTLDSNRIHPANMFIMKWAFFDHYCSFLFNILDLFESVVVNNGWSNNLREDKSFARVSGFMAELLTSSFIDMTIDQGAKVKYANCIILH